MILNKGLPPVIITNTGTITLTNCLKPEYSFNDHDFILHKSVITGKRTIVSKGTYASARLLMHSFTYAQYLLLKALRGTVVTFYPYGNTTIVYGSTTYNLPSITMIVTKAKFFHFDNLTFTDGCMLEMESESYYELSLTGAGT